jgi:DNA-binding transcriptional LysR family regulator
MNSDDAIALLARVSQFEELPALNLDQMMNFLAVCHTRRYGKVRELVKRDHSGAESMVVRLQERFGGIVGDKFLTERKGEPLQLTVPGERVQRMCVEILDCVDRAIQDLRRLATQENVRIGMTRFMDSLVRDICVSALSRAHPQKPLALLEIVHTPSADIQQSVLRKDVDLCVGSILVRKGSSPAMIDGVEFVELKREEFGLLSTYELGAKIPMRALVERRLPVVIPMRGMIRNLLRSEFPGELDKLARPGN